MVATGEVLAGRYRVGELLGRGGMAEVHRGEDLGSGDPVAVKLLRGIDADAARRLAGEQRVLSRLRHPGLVGLRDSGTHRGDPFLVLDLVEGSDLATLLLAGPLELDVAAALLMPVAEGLAHAHAAGVVHRDVKPANILVERGKGARLADFGIARVAGATRHTATGHVIGTAVYLAPEQVRGERVGAAADIYALGLVLLECVTGERAFPGAPVESAMARLMRGPDVPEALPAWLRQLLHSMTATQPEHRPSAAEVAKELRPQAPVEAKTDEAETALLEQPGPDEVVTEVLRPHPAGVVAGAAGSMARNAVPSAAGSAADSMARNAVPSAAGSAAGSMARNAVPSAAGSAAGSTPRNANPGGAGEIPETQALPWVQPELAAATVVFADGRAPARPWWRSSRAIWLAALCALVIIVAGALVGAVQGRSSTVPLRTVPPSTMLVTTAVTTTPTTAATTAPTETSVDTTTRPFGQGRRKQKQDSVPYTYNNQWQSGD